MPRKKLPWPPVIPARLANTLTPYSVHRDGWVRWYRGKTRHVCGKSTPLDRVDDCWRDVKARVDAEVAGAFVVDRTGLTVLEAGGLFFDYLQHRVTTGQPKPMSVFTAADYERTINAFGRSAGPHTLLADVAQPHFQAFAIAFAGKAPSTLARNVAYVQAFFRWCVENDHLAGLPRWGSYFVKPARQAHRDVRLDQQKGYTPAELRKLRDAATPEEKAWLALGLAGAMDNSDLAHLTTGLIDHRQKLIDYRRRKTGKVRRVMPLPPAAYRWLGSYTRPPPANAADADRVFLTPTGLPLQRLKDGPSGQANPIDYVAMRWGRLLIRAGLRERMPRRRDKAHRDLPKRKKGEGTGDGRGFRGLRTTFANLAPPGYRDEIEIIMGHAQGTVLLDNYIETLGVDRLLSRLCEVVNHVWHQAFIATLPRFSDSRFDRVIGVVPVRGVAAAGHPSARRPSTA
jgi:site-specific recombinase XerD